MKQWLLQVSALSKLSVLELYRRKDLAVVFLLAMIILLPLAFLAPFGVSGASRYVSELAMLLIWLFSIIIGLGVSVRLFPPEFESRTIYPLLAKPVGRGTVLFGKYLGALSASVSAVSVFYLAYAVLVGVRQGEWFAPVLFQAALLHVGFLMVITALTLLGSLVMTPSAALTLCALTAVGMLAFGQRLPVLAAAQTGPGRWVLQTIHWLAPHLEFFDMRQRLVHAWPCVEWRVCTAVLAYAVCYAGLCLALAGWAFRRKRL